VIYKIETENEYSLKFFEQCLIQIRKEYNVYENDKLDKMDGRYGIEVNSLYEFEELIVLLNNLVKTDDIYYEVILRTDNEDGQMYILLD